MEPPDAPPACRNERVQRNQWVMSLPLGRTLVRWISASCPATSVPWPKDLIIPPGASSDLVAVQGS